MKLKRILYCILSLVVVLSFLPGCELFLKEPKEPKKPKKEWPCDVVPQEPPTEYGNFIAFKLNGIPFAYANCPKNYYPIKLIYFFPDIRRVDRKYMFRIPEGVASCNEDDVRIVCSFELPSDNVLGSKLPYHFSISVFGEDEVKNRLETGSYELLPELPNKMELTFYKPSGQCGGSFSGSLVLKKYFPDPDYPGTKKLFPVDTVQLTDGVISIMDFYWN